jgi:uncharacterized protein (TIGR03083 family)
LTVDSGLVTEAVAETQRTLGPYVEANWNAPAGDLDWSCRQTGVHIASSLLWYAGQVVGQDTEGYVGFDIVMDDGTGPDELLRAITLFGAVLSRVITAADPSDRAFHFYGVSDPDGFAAMGALETMVHTYDICQGLGIDWRPPNHLCTPVLARLFPDAPAGEPAAALLWCTGRSALDDLPRRSEWGWDATVRSEGRIDRSPQLEVESSDR